jgi:amino acid transporter
LGIIHLGYYLPDLATWQVRLISLGVVALVVVALYRPIASIGKLTTVLWAIMLVAVGGVTLASFTHFDAARAFTVPDGALRLDGRFFSGLGAGLYNAAKDRLFFPVFGRLHPRRRFPHVSLLAMAAITAIGSLFTLDDVINMLVAVMVILQSLAQIAALTILRRRQPTLRRPYRMFLYPLPSAVAVIGWIYVYWASGKAAMGLSLAWIAAGTIAFLIWARVERTWPFGPRAIHEEYLTAQRDAGQGS